MPKPTWSSVLDGLEHDLAVAAELLNHGNVEGDPVSLEGTGLGGAWVPPKGLGPLPPHLAERARSVVSRQRDLVARLSEAAGEGRKQSQLVNSMKLDGRATPVLLDQNA